MVQHAPTWYNMPQHGTTWYNIDRQGCRGRGVGVGVGVGVGGYPRTPKLLTVNGLGRLGRHKSLALKDL